MRGNNIELAVAAVALGIRKRADGPLRTGHKERLTWENLWGSWDPFDLFSFLMELMCSFVHLLSNY